MSAPITNFQGIAVDPRGVNKDAFMALTRRKRVPEVARTWAGIGGVDNITIRKSDIMSAIRIRLTGSIVVTGTTSVTTAAWPYGLLKNCKLIANGQSNLIDCSGPHLKFREFAVNTELTDRGIIKSVGGANVQNGSLSLNTETWGVGNASSALTAGTYNFELEYFVPVAEDDKDLAGAIFCQTSSMDITLALQWANLADVFTQNAGTVTFGTVTLVIETEKFSIPVSNGIMILPDLSLFHSIVQTSTSTITNGDNQVRLIGQGSGKSLLRLWFRVLNGAAGVAAPLAVNAVNYGNQSWQYGTSEKPEVYQDGTSLREWNEWAYGTDVAAVWGFQCHDFAYANAFRDVVDMGQTSELRLSTVIQTGVTLTSPSLEYTQETIFAAAA